MDLFTPVEKIPRIGPVFQRRLKRLKIKTVRDLIFHLPHRYEDFSNIVKISEIKPNEINSVRGKIIEIKNSKTWRRRMILTQAIVSDDSGSVRIIWFNQPYLINTLKPQDFVCLAGKASQEKEGLYLSSPVYEKISETENATLTHTGRIIPVYPETEGLSSR